MNSLHEPSAVREPCQKHKPVWAPCLLRLFVDEVSHPEATSRAAFHPQPHGARTESQGVAEFTRNSEGDIS